MERAVRLMLVCAGITDGMRDNRFPDDAGLEKRSRRLTESLRDWLPRAGRAFAGPSLRAAETADILGLSATVRDDLRDQAYGSWAGRSLVEVEAMQPGGLAAWLADPAFAPEGGEPLAAVAERASGFLREMSGMAGQVVAVTHGAVVRTAVLHVLAAPLASFRQMDAGPLSVTDLRFDGRRWALRAHGMPSCGPDGDA